MLARLHGTDEQQVSWNLRPVIALLALLFLGYLLIYWLVQLAAQDQRVVPIAGPLAGFYSLLATFAWIRFRMRLRLSAIGLTGGAYGATASLLLGGSVGMLLGLMSSLGGTHPGQPVRSPLVLLIVPFTPIGATMTIAGPLWEEALYRGLLFGYLRTRMSIGSALALQAAVTAILHLDFVGEGGFESLAFRFVAAVVLGALYQVSRSLYTAIGCHSVLNYCAIVL